MGKDGISGPKGKGRWSIKLRIKGLMYLQNVLITKSKAVIMYKEGVL